MDCLVIGAGPAGLQLGSFLKRAGRDYLILEAGRAPGTFFGRFPRHRRLISINKPHTGWDDPELNLRMDWNSLLSDDPRLLFTRYTGRYLPDAGCRCAASTPPRQRPRGAARSRCRSSRSRRSSSSGRAFPC